MQFSYCCCAEYFFCSLGNIKSLSAIVAGVVAQLCAPMAINGATDSQVGH